LAFEVFKKNFKEGRENLFLDIGWLKSPKLHGSLNDNNLTMSEIILTIYENKMLYIIYA